MPTRSGAAARPAGHPVRVPPLEEPWLSLRGAYQSLRQHWEAVLARFDLSFSEYLLLGTCDPAPARATDVARRIGITPAGATDLIDRMEERRLVERTADPRDRRAVLIRLSPSGVRRYRETKSAVRAILRELDVALTESERRALVRGLSALARALADDPP